MNNLILDVKIMIASFHEDTWYHLYCYDEEFRKYSTKITSIQKFIELFTIRKVEMNEHYQIESYYLFGKLHRNELPALIYTGNCHTILEDNNFSVRSGGIYRKNYSYQIWYQCGKVHKLNDYAVIGSYDNEVEYYASYYEGKLHSYHDKSSLIYYNAQHWHSNGNRHRGDNLPAVVYADSQMEWWKNNVRIK